MPTIIVIYGIFSAIGMFSSFLAIFTIDPYYEKIMFFLSFLAHAFSMYILFVAL
jgi:hypothetical protein